MATWEIAVAAFLWGIIAGLVLERWTRTGRWSLWP